MNFNFEEDWEELDPNDKEIGYFVCDRHRNFITDKYCKEFYNKSKPKLHKNIKNAYKEMKSNFYDDSDYQIVEIDKNGETRIIFWKELKKMLKITKFNENNVFEEDWEEEELDKKTIIVFMDHIKIYFGEIIKIKSNNYKLKIFNYDKLYSLNDIKPLSGNIRIKNWNLEPGKTEEDYNVIFVTTEVLRDIKNNPEKYINE